MSYLRHVFLRAPHTLVREIFAAFSRALGEASVAPLRPYVDVQGLGVVSGWRRRSVRFNVAVDRLLAEALRRAATTTPLELDTLWALNAALLDMSPPPDGLALWFRVTDFGHGVPQVLRGGEGPSVAAPAELTGLRGFVAAVATSAAATRAGAQSDLVKLGELLAACAKGDAVAVIS